MHIRLTHLIPGILELVDTLYHFSAIIKQEAGILFLKNVNANENRRFLMENRITRTQIEQFHTRLVEDEKSEATIEKYLRDVESFFPLPETRP